MIIHKPDNLRLPHEGLEYLHKSKEPETLAECLDLFCWYCIHCGNYVFFQNCEHYKKLRAKV